MARTDLTVTTLDDSGVAPAATAGTVDGHAFRNNGKEVLVLKNGGAGAHTVTIPTPVTRDDLAVADRTIALAAGQVKYAGPFTPSDYNQSGANEGKVFVNFDATESEVTVIALKMPG